MEATSHPVFLVVFYVFALSCILRLAFSLLRLIRGYLALIRATVRTAVAVRKAFPGETG